MSLERLRVKDEPTRPFAPRISIFIIKFYSNVILYYMFYYIFFHN
jgi:hypothetical protein